jgi:GntR family transcriptional regulator
MYIQLEPLHFEASVSMAFQPTSQIPPNTLEYVAQVAREAPLHVRIRESLRQQVLTGHYKPGDRIPSEEDLAKDWQVNRLTARRSISDLVNEGLLQRRPGIGTFVIGRRLLRDISALVSFWQSTRDLGMKPSAKLIGAEEIPAPMDIAEPLEIAEGDPVYRIRRQRLSDGEVMAYHIAHIPAQYLPGLLKKDLSRLSLYALYRAGGYAPTTGEQRIGAQATGPELARLLSISPGSPVLSLHRTTRATSGRPIEFLIAYYRSDRHVIYMPLHLGKEMAGNVSRRGQGLAMEHDWALRGKKAGALSGITETQNNIRKIPGKISKNGGLSPGAGQAESYKKYKKRR